LELQQALNAYLKHSGETHASLGDHIGVSHQTIRNWKRGRTKPDSGQLLALLNAVRADATLRRSLWAELLDVKTSDLPSVMGLE